MISISGFCTGDRRFARASNRISPARTGREKPAGLEPVDGQSVFTPVIRYLALAFIFFQVATTAALATQVVLFESGAVDVLPN